jgi:hypothetical protein
MKDNFSLTPDFTRTHDPYCNCFDCSTDNVDGVISNTGSTTITKYPESKLIFAPFGKTVTVYRNDGKTRTVSNGNAIGMASAEIKTSSGVVLQLPNGEFVSKSSVDPTQLTATQIAIDAKNQTTEKINFLPDSVNDKIYSAGGYLDQLSGFWEKFKWLIIVIFVIMIIGLFLRVKG